MCVQVRACAHELADMCRHVRTGWLNVLGQFAATATGGALMANHIANMWLLANGHTFNSVELLLTYACASLLLFFP